jgi:hypothetical protein
MHSKLVLAAVLATSAATGGTARADGYRLPVTISDLVGGGAFAAGIQLDIDTTPGLFLATGGLVVGGLGSSVIHGAEGNPGRMVLSVLLKGGLSVGGAMIGKRVAQQSYKKFRSGAGLLGAMAGYAVATIVDIAMASTDDTTNNKRVVSFGLTF